MSARKLQPVGTDLRSRKALLEADTSDPDVVAQAVEIVDRALSGLGLGKSTMSSILYTRCHYHIPTSAVPTMAVVLATDGTAMLAYNPEFTVDLGVDGATFVLAHEARHVIMRHLFNDGSLRSDKVFTTAIEACINHVVSDRLSMPMPKATVTTVSEKTGRVAQKREKSGIDPKELYKKYKEDLEAQGAHTATFADFIKTDLACYHELSRMKNEPQSGFGSGGVGECVHQSPSNQDDGGAADDNMQDQETVDELAKDVLNATMKAAMSGKRDAKEELLGLGDRTDGATDRVSKIWGRLGLGKLRGQTASNMRVDWWKQWFQDTLASKIEPGERLIYPKKRGAIDALLGMDPVLMRRGDEELKVACICIDTSGSMPGKVIEWLTQLVGYTDGLEIHWLAFDAEVIPFVPGEPAAGGGGTSFEAVMDYVEGRTEVNGRRLDSYPDAVVVLTDGYASPIRPQDPARWMWLITEGGSDEWICGQSNPMDSYHLKTGEGLN